MVVTASPLQGAVIFSFVSKYCRQISFHNCFFLIDDFGARVGNTGREERDS